MAGAPEGEDGPGAGVIHFSRAPFTSRFVDRMGPLAARVAPTSVASPRLLAWSDEFAARFRLAAPDDADVAALAGNQVPPGAVAYAARYGGHQFGHWAGQLGDGRAIGYGELADADGVPWEIQLKGAGPTPFSRRADGRAVLRSSVREFICGEAMHALGVPTTRALALLATGDGVLRDMFYDGNPAVEPGAIVVRVAPSFLRFGSFEIHAAEQDRAGLKRMIDFVITTYYPHLGAPGPDAYVALFRQVAVRTAELMTRWMSLGFVHGVMNTDNMSILGLTIDYGPYGWLEEYDPAWTPNTTDLPGRRYAFGRQPAVAEWNLAQFGSAIAVLDDALIPALEDAMPVYAETFGASYARALGAKLGLRTLDDAEGRELVTGLDALMRASGADFTRLYRAFATKPSAADVQAVCYRAPTPELTARWTRWLGDYHARVAAENQDPAARAAAMNAVNPRFVPRNYLLQEAIDLATAGDPSRLDELRRVLSRPYADQPGKEAFAALRPDWARTKAGCSTLSCSS